MSKTRLDCVEGRTGYLAGLSENLPLKLEPHRKMSCSKIQRDKNSRRLKRPHETFFEHTNGKGRLPKPSCRTYELRVSCLLYICNLYTTNICVLILQVFLRVP